MEQCTQKERKHPEAIVEGFSKTVQRHTAPHLEHRILLISIFIGNLLPNIKQQVKRLHQPLDIFQVATQFFEELETTVFCFTIIEMQH